MTADRIGLRTLAVRVVVALLAALLLTPTPVLAQNENGSGAQSNAQAPPLDADSEDGGSEDPEPAPGVEPQTSLPDIEDEVNCVVCGVTLDRATEAPQALQERELIRELIAQGLTKDEVKDRLVDEYGPDVLATPATSGFDLFAWLVPAVVVIVALIGIIIGLRRWRSRPPDGGDGDGGSGVGSMPEVDESDRLRIDRDLERYGI